VITGFYHSRFGKTTTEVAFGFRSDVLEPNIRNRNFRVTVQLGAGRHYLQEDHAEVIGASINEWLIDLGVASSSKHKLTA